MRVVLFIGYLFSLLLSGSSDLLSTSTPSVKTHYTTQKLTDQHWAAFSNKDQVTLLIEDNESDIEEEFHSGNDLKNKNNLSFGTSNNTYHYSDSALPYLTTRLDHTCGKTIVSSF